MYAVKLTVNVTEVALLFTNVSSLLAPTPNNADVLTDTFAPNDNNGAELGTPAGYANNDPAPVPLDTDTVSCTDVASDGTVVDPPITTTDRDACAATDTALSTFTGPTA